MRAEGAREAPPTVTEAVWRVLTVRWHSAVLLLESSTPGVGGLFLRLTYKREEICSRT